MMWIEHAIVAWLAIGLPIWDHFEIRRLKATPTDAAKVRMYRITITWLWIVAALAVLARGWDALYRPPAACIPPAVASWNLTPVVIGVVVLLAAWTIPLILARYREAVREKVVREFEAMSFFVPGTPRSRAWFAAVSVTAGICEEIVYRSFLLAYFCDSISVGFWPGVVIACVVFAIAHAYQGGAGVVMTAVLAFLFFVLFIGTGSLLVPIVVHALVDLRILLAPLPDDDSGAGARDSGTPV